MTDQELADRIVALGVGAHTSHGYELYHDSGSCDFTGAFLKFEPHEYVRDWGVAGALMERCDRVFIERLTRTVWTCRADGPTKTREWHNDANQARAIISACAEALEAQ